MKIIKVELQGINGEIELYGMGDLHIGSSNCNLQLIRYFIDFILEKKNRYVVFGGDLMDMTFKDSKGNIYENEMTPQSALTFACNLLKPLVEADRVLCTLGGNHDDDRSMRLIGISMAKQLAVMLGIPELYSPDDVVILAHVKGVKNNKDKESTYKIFASHGNNGGGGTTGSKANALEKMALIYPTADVYMHFHTHAPIVFKDEYVDVVMERAICVMRERLFVNFPALMNWVNSYGEKRLMKPQSQSIPKIRLNTIREKNKDIDRLYKSMSCEI